jgi:hypothetical protein
MDYLTRRTVVLQYGAKGSHIGGPRGVPRLSAAGPRAIYRGRLSLASSLPSLLVPVREVTAAIDDLCLTEVVGGLPQPVAPEYPSRPFNLLDAFEVEKLLEKTELTVEEIKKRSDEFFEELRGPHPTVDAPEEVVAKFPNVTAAGLPIRMSVPRPEAQYGRIFVPRVALEALKKGPDFMGDVLAEACLFYGKYAHHVERALLRGQGASGSDSSPRT